MKIVSSAGKCLILAMLFLVGCRASRPTGISLVTKENPPTFKLSGNGNFLTLTVSGPFPNLDELQHDSGKYVSVWEINTSTTANSHTPVEDLPQVTYGVAPREFAQFFPHENQKPVALEPGKFYKAKAFATHSKSDGRGGWIWEHSDVCFTVMARGIDEVPCFAPGEGGYGPGKSVSK